MEKQEIKVLADYLDQLADEIPNGLSRLKDAVSFACIEMRMYLRIGRKGPQFNKAITFAKSIPVEEDLKSPKMADWMLHDIEHKKYM